jgi:hypothetical protein
VPPERRPFIVPRLLDDEWDAGYFGRFARWNGLSPQEAAATQFGLKDPSSPWRSKRLTTGSNLATLAAAAGVDDADLIRDHSLLGLDQAIVDADEDTRPPEIASLMVRQLDHHSFWQEEARACPLCALEDVRHLGVGLWRRSHQIPGQLWCPTHGIALYKACGSNVLLLSTLLAIESATEVPEEVVQESLGNAAVNSFLGLQHKILREGVSVNWQIANHLIGVDTSLPFDWISPGVDLSRRKDVTEVIDSTYPRAWLSCTLPARLWSIYAGEGNAAYRPRGRDLQRVVLLLIAAFDDYGGFPSAIHAPASNAARSPPPPQRDLFIDGERCSQGRAVPPGNLAQSGIRLRSKRKSA